VDHNSKNLMPLMLTATTLVVLTAMVSTIVLAGLDKPVGLGAAAVVAVILVHYAAYSVGYFFRKGWNKADVV